MHLVKGEVAHSNWFMLSGKHKAVDFGSHRKHWTYLNRTLFLWGKPGTVRPRSLLLCHLLLFYVINYCDLLQRRSVIKCSWQVMESCVDRLPHSSLPWSEWVVRTWIACRHLLTHHITPLPTSPCTAPSQVAILLSPQGIVLAFTQGQKCLLGPLSILMSCINMAIALKGQWRNQKPRQLFCCAVFIS